jgi:hypothetical protein
VENKVYVEVSVPVKKTSAGLELDIFSSEQTIVCKKGESIILTGLFQKLTTRLGNRTPLLGYIPLVDMFFSQRDKKGSQKELVALLTQSTILPRPSTVVPFSTSGPGCQIPFRHADPPSPLTHHGSHRGQRRRVQRAPVRSDGGRLTIGRSVECDIILRNKDVSHTPRSDPDS